MLFWLTCTLTSKAAPNASDIAKLNPKVFDDSDVESAADEVWKMYEALGAGDQIAKGPELRKTSTEALTKRFPLKKIVGQ